MQVHRRLAAVGAALAALVAAAPASAGIWTPVSSGTTADITAVDYVSAGTIVYGTANGQILKNGVVKNSDPGFSVNDIAFSPSGTVGLAVANNGKLWRSANGGESWSLVPLTNTTFNWAAGSGCPASSPPYTRTATPAGNLTAVSWGDDGTAYVVGVDKGMVLKTSTGGGAGSWTDISRQSDGTCRAGQFELLTDVDAITANLVWFLDDSFGGRWISSNGLTSAAAHFNSTAANCFDKRTQLAVDHDNPNRSFVTDACSGSLQLGFSQDGGNNYDISPTYVNGSADSLSGLNGVAIAGGSALAVGNAGAILVDNDGRNVYFQRADGIDQTNDWLAVAKLDAGNAVVVGRGGRMVTSTQANAIPDVVAPAGTVSGPTTATAGTPVTYTANVADNAGGSGIDPAGFAWSATGLPAATGNPVTVTFPSPGFYTLTVAFKDLAGNAGTASIGVQVGAAVTPKPVTTTVAVPGAKITFGVPATCVAPGKTFTVTLTWKKQKRKGNKFVKVRRADFYIGSKRVKIDTRAPFRQTLTVTASTKPGSTVTLKARAYIKVKRGKSPTKSITSKIKVCG